MVSLCCVAKFYVAIVDEGEEHEEDDDNNEEMIQDLRSVWRWLSVDFHLVRSYM